MAAWVAPAVIAGISALSSWLSNRNKNNATQLPVTPEAYQGLEGTLINQIMKRLSGGSSLPSGYEAGQIGGINRTYDLANQSLGNQLTARGLGQSPIAGAGAAQMQQSRAGDIVRMQQGLPLLERQLGNEDLDLARQVLGAARGVQTTSGAGGLAGGATSLANMLAFLYGSGAFGGGSKVPAGLTNYPGIQTTF